jgi:DNA (cytosine-5)-methyltransferase 1
MITSNLWVRDGGGILVPTERPVAIDLFCGAGGFSLGFMQAGWHVIAGMDNDPSCLYTYLYNLGSRPAAIHFACDDDRERLEQFMRRELRKRGRIELSGEGWIKQNPGWPVYHFFFGDCRRWTGEAILSAIGLEREQVGAVIGGPPCQGFSRAGRRDVMDERNSFVFEFARLVCEITPQTMVFENVPGIASMVTADGLNVLDAMCSILEEGGFGTVDALRRGLLASSGAGAALQTRQVKTPARPAGESVQMELFG